MHYDACPFSLDPSFLCSRTAEGEKKMGWIGQRSRGKRRRKNRKQNSICSGLDCSFFSLERLALNPICASCQLCPRVPCGGLKNNASDCQANSGSGRGMTDP